MAGAESAGKNRSGGQTQSESPGRPSFTPTPEAVEAVAKALYGTERKTPWEELSPGDPRAFEGRAEARAAIAAFVEALKREGWHITQIPPDHPDHPSKQRARDGRPLEEA